MAELTEQHEQEEDFAPGGVLGDDPREAPEGSVLDDLVALREALDATQTEDFPLPGFEGRLWGTYRLPQTKQAWRLTKRLADDATSNAALQNEAAAFLYHCTVELWYVGPDGQRKPIQGVPEGEPATYDNLPARVVPPRPGGREHDDASRVLALFNGRGGIVLTHAAGVAGWAQSGERAAAEEAAGEFGGDRS